MLRIITIDRIGSSLLETNRQVGTLRGRSAWDATTICDIHGASILTKRESSKELASERQHMDVLARLS
jgi:hypothetical protein